MNCKHENADHLMPGDWWTCGQRRAPSMVVAEQFRCIDCGCYLSLGPANDDGTAIEIRAAEIAAGLIEGGCEMSMLETCGFNDESPKLRGGGVVLLDTFGQRAGSLAHAIVSHEES
jgi:hypothetical protein